MIVAPQEKAPIPLTNFLCASYSVLTLANVQWIEREKGARQPKPMSTQEQFVQQFAKLFHHYTEALSTGESQERASEDSRSRDESDRLVAAARLAILELEANGRIKESSRRYYAQPGEAEWGC